MSGAEAVDALAQALRTRGLAPAPESGLSLDDYISSSAADPDSRTVSFLLGPDGRLVPSDEWRDYHPDYCEARARHARPAASRASFRVVQNTERQNGRTRNQLWVFGRVADVGTGRTHEASEGEVSNMPGVDRADEGWTADALEEALSELQTPMAPPGSLCGEVRLEHVAGREVGDDFVFQAGFQGHGQHLGYAWDFGDGGTAEGRSLQRPRHVYSDEGTYPVTVYGPGDEVRSQTVSVRAEPVRWFRAELAGEVDRVLEGPFEREGRFSGQTGTESPSCVYRVKLDSAEGWEVWVATETPHLAPGEAYPVRTPFERGGREVHLRRTVDGAVVVRVTPPLPPGAGRHEPSAIYYGTSGTLTFSEFDARFGRHEGRRVVGRLTAALERYGHVRDERGQPPPLVDLVGLGAIELELEFASDRALQPTQFGDCGP